MSVTGPSIAYPRPSEDQHVVLDVLADLLDLRIGQDRPERLQRRRVVEPSVPIGPRTGR